MNSSDFQLGDLVIYLMTKQSAHPTLRAKTVAPSESGEDYRYLVEKFWIVCEITKEGELIVQTRRGKTRTISPEDPNLKRANWWQRWLYRGRFPTIDKRQTPEHIQLSN